MSRIGKRPVPLPKGVTAAVNDNVVSVKGPKGEMKLVLVPDVSAKVAEDAFTFKPPTDAKKIEFLTQTSAPPRKKIPFSPAFAPTP